MHRLLLLLPLVICGILPSPADLVISEFLASNQSNLFDEDGDASDWIEIHNNGPDSLNLSGWSLTDDVNQLQKWTFPNLDLAAEASLIVFASGKDRSTPGQTLHANFKLSASGEFLALVSPASQAISSYQFPPQETDISFGTSGSSNQVVLIPETAPVKVLIPDLDDHQAIGKTWQGGDPTFDDSTWRAGTLGVGFDRNAGFATEIKTDLFDTAWGVNASAYLRIPISGNLDPTNIETLTLRIKCDDGFTAFLNGTSTVALNSPDPLTWNSSATSATPNEQALQFQNFDLTRNITDLLSDQNILAIHALNQSSISGDFLVRPELIATLKSPGPTTVGYFITPTPGESNPATNTPTPIGAPAGEVTISESSGVKSSSFFVSLTSENDPAEIRFTLDGSDPDSNSPLYSAPISIASPTQLRARSFEPGRTPGPISPGDYAFLDSSLQSYLSDLPVIVMDNFGAGAYPNKGRTNDGHDVQQVPRQANVVAFYHPSENGLPLTQTPAMESRSGCRVRGSSSSGFPRKPLSVEFWKDDNSDRKLSPFGFDAEADWILNPPNPTFDRSLIHNPVAYNIAQALGTLAPNSKIVAVFQNTNGGTIGLSDLAGLYIFTEKIERGRMGLDFKKLSPDGQSGGWMINIDRMPAIPVGMPANTIQPNFHAAGPNGILQIPDDQQNSGGSQSVDDISVFYHSYLNFHSPDAYDIAPAQRGEIQTAIRAMDSAVWAADANDPISGYRAHLDAPSWARFFAVHNLTKNQDAHVLSTFVFRDTPSSKIKMGPAWDFDRAFTWKGGATNTPLWASNRDWYRGLFADDHFRQTHQDLWQKARQTTLTNSALESFIDEASAAPNPGQISASGLTFPTWQNRLTEMKSYLVTRANYLDSQYEPLPTISPEDAVFTDTLKVILTPSDGGTTYYTTDGSDPRLDDGTTSPVAIAATAPLEFSTRTRLIARTLDGPRWSGPVEKTYYQTSHLPSLVFSEIHYHPADPSPAEIAQGYDADDFEFLEILNTGSSSASLSPLALSSGVSFEFSTSPITELGPGAHLLVVRNQTAFEFRYGDSFSIAGEYQGALNNAGETLTLADLVLQIDLHSVTYHDDSPWPRCADGDGFSLVLKNPANNPNSDLATHWRCSSSSNGNPGSSDARPAFVGNPAADLDRDNLTALLEHFLGTSDSEFNDGPPDFKLGNPVLVDDIAYPTFQVTATIGADDISPAACWSSDLQNWTTQPDKIVLTNHLVNNDGTATLIWRSTTPLTDSPQFFKLQVTKP